MKKPLCNCDNIGPDQHAHLYSIWFVTIGLGNNGYQVSIFLKKNINTFGLKKPHLIKSCGDLPGSFVVL